MFTPFSNLTRLCRRLRLSAANTAPVILGLALLGSPNAQAKPVPSNLGNGLDKLVASNLAVADALKKGVDTRGFVRAANNQLYTDKATAAVAANALGDGAGRVLVRVTLDGAKTATDLKTALESSISSVSVTAVDTKYRGVGIMNAYVSVDDVPKLASALGVMAVVLEWKPRHNRVLTTMAPAPVAQGTVAGPVTPGKPGVVANLPYPTAGEVLNKLGTTFDQGVTQHGIDQINKFYNPNSTLDLEGQGMQIACLSNNFAGNRFSSASTDVDNGDLPGGTSNNSMNTTPVFVLQDDVNPNGDEEGRAMCQIVYKMAPKAAIGFATADAGEVGFTNNIRGLAGLAGYTVSGQTFAADVICDDVSYLDEPFFQDGIIADGVTDVYDAGVSYFASAGNDIGTDGYDSDTRWVANGTGLTAAAGNTALAGTNIDLTGVPANLYAGGFHNFNPNTGALDVAQTVNMGINDAVPLIFQWNDPYDQNTTIAGTTQIFSASASFITQPITFKIPASVTAGTHYQFAEAHGYPSIFDGVVTVYKSDGTTVLAGPQDNGQDETVRLIAPANDTGFVVKVDHSGLTHGPFTLNVQSYTGFSTPAVSTSLSVLAFDMTGAYLPGSSLTLDATKTNEPIQLGYTEYSYNDTTTQLQYVIARSVVPAVGFNYPTHIRYLLPANGLPGFGPAEYFTYNTVTTGGHEMANSCNGCAAYSVFRPSLPEYFTSPGPATVYYDRAGNRLATPEVRLQPRFAFADGANVSANLSAVFANDNGYDPDTTQGQFYGTSATGPHAAAIAALVLQKHGGRRSVTPAQMTSVLERSTLPHDLDPNFASGSARVTGGTSGTGKVTLTISSDGGAGSITEGTGLGDTTAFSVSYVGGSSVTSLVFNPNGLLANAGNVSGGNNGVTYSSSEDTVGGTVTYFENSLPGVVFLTDDNAFTLDATLPDSVAGATAAGSNANGDNATQYKTLAITVPNGSFPSFKKLRFTVGRGLAFDSTVGDNYNVVTNAASGAAFYSADIFGGGVILPEGKVNASGMRFTGTTADGGTFTGTIVNRIGKGWAKTDGYGFVSAPMAVNQTVQ